MSSAAPTATSLDALTAAGLVMAKFHAGQSAAGHHWTIEDGAGTELARTRRVHNGGALKRAAWKAITLTGMDNGNDIHVELVGANKTVLAKLSSFNAKPRVVTVTDALGLAVARTTNADGRITLESGDPGRVLATIDHEGDGPWAVVDPGGAVLGELLAGDPGPTTTASMFELLVPYAPNMSSDFARTMHLGVRRVLRYAMAPVAGRSVVAPVALLPLLAGLTY